jgi:hypothetical protein
MTHALMQVAHEHCNGKLLLALEVSTINMRIRI